MKENEIIRDKIFLTGAFDNYRNRKGWKADENQPYEDLYNQYLKLQSFFDENKGEDYSKIRNDGVIKDKKGHKDICVILMPSYGFMLIILKDPMAC